MFESLKTKQPAEINNFLKNSINMFTVGDANSNIPYKPIGRYSYEMSHVFQLSARLPF